MLTFLIEKIAKWRDRGRWAEPGSLTTDFSYEPAIPVDPPEDILCSRHVSIDLCEDIPRTPEMDLDASEPADSRQTAASQPIKCMSDFAVCDLAASGVPEDGRLAAKQHISIDSTRGFGHMASQRSLLTSFLLHASMICLAAFAATTHAKGIYGSGGESIMVRFVAQEECVPVEETPASVDSAASAPSVEGKPDHHKKEKSPDKKEQQAPAVEARADSTREDRQEEPKEKEIQQEETKKPEKPTETKQGDGPINSVASLPSVASEERRILSAGGSDMEDFQSRILAAIREAIFFPKRALDQRKHGETVVQFTLNRDGSVSNLSVNRESGSLVLDEAALTIVRKASKNFPSIPGRLAKEGIDYVVPIHFKEKRPHAANNTSEGQRALSE